jgi:hypothetical protein
MNKEECDPRKKRWAGLQHLLAQQVLRTGHRLLVSLMHSSMAVVLKFPCVFCGAVCESLMTSIVNTIGHSYYGVGTVLYFYPYLSIYGS